MKILLNSRIDLFKRPGGDTAQILKTAEYLKGLGVPVDISEKLKQNLDNYDLVHLFNITRPHETYIQFQNAKKQKKPIVITPLYQNFDEWDEKGRYGLQSAFMKMIPDKNTKELTKTFLRALTNINLYRPFMIQFVKGFIKQQKEILAKVDLVLTNSEMEMRKIEKDLKIKNNYQVVPNGIELSFAYAKPDIFKNKYKLENFILCVAHFASIKNHLNLIKALKDTNLFLVLVGKQQKAHKKYFRLIKKEAERNQKIRLLENISQEELKSAYAAAKVHVLPSWFETCGLVSLEAGLAGCNIVSTDRGYAKEYLKDFAWYCNPDDLNSIREVVIKAYHHPKSDQLKNHIIENFSWEKTAQKTLEAYHRVLNR